MKHLVDACFVWKKITSFLKNRKKHEIFTIDSSMLALNGTWLSDHWNPNCQIYWYFFSICPAWAYLICHWPLILFAFSPPLPFLTPLTLTLFLFSCCFQSFLLRSSECLYSSEKQSFGFSKSIQMKVLAYMASGAIFTTMNPNICIPSPSMFPLTNNCQTFFKKLRKYTEKFVNKAKL